MIVTLTGRVAEKLPDSVIVEVAGVGYGLLVPFETYGNLKVGQDTKLYIYEHIREVAHDLYGFIEQDSKNLFEQLLNVNGVGPKVALAILNVGSSGELRQAIASGDVKLIQSAAGVGKKVAERVIVELKNKVGLLSQLDEQSFLVSDSVAQKDDAVQALVALGYSVPDAVNALSEVDKKLPTEQRIKQALKGQV